MPLANILRKVAADPAATASAAAFANALADEMDAQAAADAEAELVGKVVMAVQETPETGGAIAAIVDGTVTPDAPAS